MVQKFRLIARKGNKVKVSQPLTKTKLLNAIAKEHVKPSKSGMVKKGKVTFQIVGE